MVARNNHGADAPEALPPSSRATATAKTSREPRKDSKPTGASWRLGASDLGTDFDSVRSDPATYTVDDQDQVGEVEPETEVISRSRAMRAAMAAPGSRPSCERKLHLGYGVDPSSKTGRDLSRRPTLLRDGHSPGSLPAAPTDVPPPRHPRPAGFAASCLPVLDASVTVSGSRTFSVSEAAPNAGIKEVEHHQLALQRRTEVALVVLAEASIRTKRYRIRRQSRRVRKASRARL